MTTPGGSRTSSHTSLAHLHPEAHAQRVATSVCEHVEELIVVASVRAQRFVRDVQRLEEHIELLGQLIARGHVDLQARIHERGFGAELGVVLVLTELQQILIAPVRRNTNLEVVLVVEADEVRGVGETRHRKAALRDVVAIVRTVRVHDRDVGVEAEARIAEHVLPCELEAVDGRIRTVDALGYRVNGRLPRRRVDDVVDRLTLRSLNDEVRHVLHEVVQGGIRVLLVVPLDREVEVIRQVRLERGITAVRRKRTHSRQRTHVQYRRQEVDRRTRQRTRRRKTQMHVRRDFQLRAQARQEVRVIALRRDRLRFRERGRQQRRIRIALRQQNRQAALTRGSDVRTLVTQTGTEMERHIADLSCEVRTNERGERLLGNVLDASRIEREVQRSTIRAQLRRIGFRALEQAISKVPARIVKSVDLLRPGVTQSLKEVVEIVRAIDEQRRRQRASTREPWNEPTRADRAAIHALGDQHARRTARRGAVTRVRLPEVVGEGIAVLQREVVIQLRCTDVAPHTFLLVSRREASLLDRIRVLLLRAHENVGADDRRIEIARRIAVRAERRELRQRVAAVAQDAHSQGRAKRAAVSDVRTIIAMVRIGVRLTLRVRRVDVEVQVLGDVDLEVGTDLIRLDVLVVYTSVQIHRRARLPEVDDGTVVVELQVAQVVFTEPERESVRFRRDLLARVVVVDREQDVVRRTPLECNATVDTLVVHLRLFCAVLLLPPADDRLVRVVELTRAAVRSELARRETAAVPARHEHAIRIRLALGVDDVRQETHRVVRESRA